LLKLSLDTRRLVVRGMLFIFPSSYQHIAMPYRRCLGTVFHLLGRALLHLFILFLCFLWILACYVFIMAVVCVLGSLKNCAEDRTGGCHDLPLLCSGMSLAAEYSAMGCAWLWAFTETRRPIVSTFNIACLWLEAYSIPPSQQPLIRAGKFRRLIA
jgi:hypothetical protein